MCVSRRCRECLCMKCDSLGTASSRSASSSMSLLHTHVYLLFATHGDCKNQRLFSSASCLRLPRVSFFLHILSQIIYILILPSISVCGDVSFSAVHPRLSLSLPLYVSVSPSVSLYRCLPLYRFVCMFLAMCYWVLGGYFVHAGAAEIRAVNRRSSRGSGGSSLSSRSSALEKSRYTC